MNVQSQATIKYAYEVGKVKLRGEGLSNVVKTEVRNTEILAKKTASSSFFKPLDIISYNIIVTNPAYTKATDIIINDDLFHQSLIEGSIKYMLLNDKIPLVKHTVNDNNLIFEIEELEPKDVLVISYLVEVDEVEEICVDITNSSKISSREVKPFSTNNLELKQKYAKIEVKKRTVDYVYLNSDISYEITLKNVGNVEAIDIEVEDLLPKTFELSANTDAVTVDGVTIDIYTFNKEDNTIKMFVRNIPPKKEAIILIKGKIIE